MTGITAEFLDQVLCHVAGAASTVHEVLAQDLRTAFPGRHVSVCDDDDIPPRLQPAAENGICLIYCVASGEHCLSLTNDAAAATGIVVALRDD
ncbi:MAG: DUF6129 family protein [Rhodocyclaceae bacterium]|jgi:hypothetical protein|nr:DUF6129 family protein [Rhodocyclaceae bacterium]